MSKPNLIVQPSGSRFSNAFNRMLEQQGIVKRTWKPVTKTGHIKGHFVRKVLRNQVRKLLAYSPGKIGLSHVSQQIKNQYGSVINRRTRKQIAKNKAEAEKHSRPKSNSRSR